jgi:hypothetical protein
MGRLFSHAFAHICLTRVSLSLTITVACCAAESAGRSRSPRALDRVLGSTNVARTTTRLRVSAWPIDVAGRPRRSGHG